MSIFVDGFMPYVKLFGITWMLIADRSYSVGVRVGVRARWWCTFRIGWLRWSWRPILDVHIHTWALGFCLSFNTFDGPHFRRWTPGTSGSL